MKSRRKKRLLALVLCVVMILSFSISVMAEGGVSASDGTEPEVTLMSEGTESPETTAETTSEITTEPTPEPTPETTPEPTQEVIPTPEATPETATATPTPEPVQDNAESLQTDVVADGSQTTEVQNAETPSVTPDAEAVEAAAVVFRQTVDNMTVVVTAQDEAVLPADAVLSVTKIESEDQVQEIKDAVAEDIAANNTTIQDMTVLDIKFLVNGQEVQPNGTVAVEFENTGYDAENGISVYHVDDANTTAVNMNATTETEADVAFETTHFSTYVVINWGKSEITATIEHYLNGDNDTPSPLYRTQTVQIPSGEIEGQMTNFTKESDEFELDKVVIVNADGQEEEVPGDRILVESNVTLRCYYDATSGSYQNGTTFFDYDVTSAETRTSRVSNNTRMSISVNGTEYTGRYYNNALYSERHDGGRQLYEFSVGDVFTYSNFTCTWLGNSWYSYQSGTSTLNAGINSNSNYGDSRKNNRLSVGQTVDNVSDYTYEVTYGGHDYNANANNQADYPVIPDLIDNLSGTNYENVNFVPDEPGLFSSEEKEGKRILDGYELQFERNGNTYTLTRVVDENGRTVVRDLSNFWPLDNDTSIDGLSGGSDDGGSHNWYFGMRYDFQFSLGDYVGDLTYSFNGDDDLWVFLDGEPIIDLGGMHSAYPVNSFSGPNYDYSKWVSIYPNECDLWEVILDEDYTEADKANLTDEQRQETHTITVLFMERGGYGSNCEMEFVLPNVAASSPVISATPRADVEFTKVNTKNEPLEGAKFKLYSDEEYQNEVGTAVSNGDGTVSFSNLRAGTYYMKEINPPSGYIAGGPWTIEVTVSGDTASYTITGNGVSKDEDSNRYQIVNQSYESNIEVDKTVEVLDYDKRTYQITLSAKSLLNWVEQQGEPVDVVLVFDTSKSMDFPGNLNVVETDVRVSNLNQNQTYYYIEPTASATVYRVYYSGNGWKYIDASKTASSDVKNITPDSDVLTTRGRYTFYEAASDVTRLDSLKVAASSFITQLNGLSSKNRVGLVTFAESANYRNDQINLGELSVNYNDLIGLINGMDSNYTESGTNQTAGLANAVEMLKKSDSSNDKYVILLTDGAPNKTNWSAIEGQADTLKTGYGVTLMTVGVGLSYVDAGIEAGGDSPEEYASTHLKEISSSNNDGTPYYYNADNTDELESLFDNLFTTIVSGIDIEGATITDVIDSRFEYVDGSLTGGGTYDQSTGTITWNNIPLPYVAETEPGWTVTFTIKAKEDFMGGNVIPTNGASSGVSVGGTTIPFPQPAVNVKSLKLELPDVNETIFLGDPVNVAANVEKIKEVLAEKVPNDIDAGESSTFSIPTECQLTEDDILALLNGSSTSISKEYSYTGATDDVEGSFVYTLTVANTMKPASTVYNADFDSNAVGSEKEKYTLTVQYIPVAAGDRPNGYVYDSNNTGKYGSLSAPRTKDGTYILNVIAGELKIVKKLDAPADSDKTFIFEIRKDSLDSQPVQTVTITIPSGGSTDSATLSGLERGSYFVTEQAAEGYELQGIATEDGTDSTNCKVTVTEDNVEFVLGTFTVDGVDKDTITDTDEKYDKGILGVAAFTNEESLGDWAIKKVSSSDNSLELSDAEFTLTKPEDPDKVYYGKTGTDGIVDWYDSPERSGTPVEKLEGGTYTLEETKAPTGYVKSEEVWTVEITQSGNLKSIMKDGKEIEGQTENGVIYYVYENTIVYDLPSAGGSGIYMYMVGGVLLMSAGVLMIYRNKRREVLNRK